MKYKASPSSFGVGVKTQEEINKMRTAGKILAKVLRELTAVASPGVTLKDLDGLAYDLIKKAGAEPAFLNYQPHGASRPFPATLCTSVNEVVVHGVPTRRRLQSGDLLKLDLGVKYAGYYADAALTIGIGEISPLTQELIQVTRQALTSAIAAAEPGNTIGDIGFSVQKTAADHGFQIIKDLTGHGIGKTLHEEPSIFNEGKM